MIRLNEKLVDRIKDRIITPEGFNIQVTYNKDYDNENNKGLFFTLRKNEGQVPHYVEEVFDFGIYFWDHHYGEKARTVDEYVDVLNNVLEKKAHGWEILLEKEKKEEEKRKLEEEKEARRVARKKARK